MELIRAPCSGNQIDAEELTKRMLAVEAVSWKGIQKCE